MKYQIKVNQIPVLLGLDKYNNKDDILSKIILTSKPKKSFIKNNYNKKNKKYYVNRTPQIDQIINKFYNHNRDEVKEIKKNFNTKIELDNIIISGSVYSICKNKENETAILLIKQRKNRIYDNMSRSDEVICQILMKLFNCNKLLYLQYYNNTFDLDEREFNKNYYDNNIIEPLINIFKNIK